MSNELTIGIIGLYTLVYIIVFFIQKSQINKTKEINDSMKSFMEIFKIDEVKKYVKMKEETVNMRAVEMILNDEKIKESMKNITNEKVDEIKKVYIDQMGGQHLEMIAVIVQVLKSLKKESRINFIEDEIPSCKHIFIPIIEKMEIEDDNNKQN